MRVVMLTGFARAGKSTVARVLEEDHGFYRMSFADPLKEMALRVNPSFDGFSLDYLVGARGWEHAKAVPGVREFLQRLGTEGVKPLFGDDVWAALAEARIPAGVERVVFDDARFDVEIEHFADPWVWEVRRPGVRGGAHASERGVSYRDAVIMNDGDLAALREAVGSLMGAAGDPGF